MMFLHISNVSHGFQKFHFDIMVWLKSIIDLIQNKVEFLTRIEQFQRKMIINTGELNWVTDRGENKILQFKSGSLKKIIFEKTQIFLSLFNFI